MQVIKLIQPRLKTVYQFFELADYFFEEVNHYDQKGIDKYWKLDNAAEILTHVAAIIQDTSFNAESLEAAFRQRADILSLKAGSLIHPARLALTGRTSTPGLFEVMAVLGRDVCGQRIQAAQKFVAAL